MIIDWRTARIAALAIALATAACGGVAGGVDGGGVTGSGLVYGPITEFGSIFVGGIEFDIDGANIELDGEAADKGDLRIGMLVEVRGSFSTVSQTGNATAVVFDSQLRGPIESVDTSSGEIRALGQVVLTTPATVFDGRTLSQLRVGDTVRISAFPDADLRLRATLVSFVGDDQSIAIEGRISGIDTEAQTFLVSGQAVDYSVAEIENEPEGGLEDGLFVEVRSDGTFEGSVLVADTIEVEDGQSGGQTGDEEDVEGVVTSVLSPTQFILNNRRTVRHGAGTVYEGGTASDIVENVRLQATGKVRIDGDLQATKISLEDEDEHDVGD